MLVTTWPTNIMMRYHRSCVTNNARQIYTHLSFTKIKYGYLSCCVTVTASGVTYAYVHCLDLLKDGVGTVITNDRDCPLLSATNYVAAVHPSDIISAVSIVHECTTDCKFKAGKSRKVERQEVDLQTGLTLEHDYTTNTFFSLNIYCMKCVYP